ncbi:hypothetical protein ACP70R_019267 [Stipagrostis hirtigluma subsp. patula]
MSSAMVAAGGKPSRSASTIVAGSTSGYHILEIDGYSRTKETPAGEFIESHPFTVGGRRWHINYYPRGRISGSKEYISLYLKLEDTISKAMKVRWQIRLVDNEQAMEEHVMPSMPVNCENMFNSLGGWGIEKFIRREDLEKSKHLKDDCFTLRCDIVVINEPRVEATLEPTPSFSVPPSNLHQHFAELLHTGKGADVVFEVGGQTFAAHRCVLAARSPVFSAELFGAMKESDNEVVHIHDMEAQVFKALLYFVYTDLLPDMKQEEGGEDVMLQHLLVAADRYNVERLKLICEKKLCRYIDVGTVAAILTLAEQHRCNGLKKVCFDFLSSSANLRAVMATDGFDHLSQSCPSIMKQLIAMLGT